MRERRRRGHTLPLHFQFEIRSDSEDSMKRSALVLAVVAVVALVSFSASSLAAGHHHKATASAVKKKPKRGARGPRGAQGPAGPAGAAGNNGTDGKEGKDGKEGREGKQGPSGVVSMSNLSLNSTTHNSTLAFIGETETVTFDAKTAAQLTASLGFGTSDGKVIQSHFAICYQPVGGALEIVQLVQPEFSVGNGESVLQTVSGVIKDLTPGDYVIGACSFNESANTVHGIGYATVIVAETR
jgi:uncharacterized low-complexity protein